MTDLKNKKAYIFDLDGTLLDTMADLATAVNHALAANGLPLRTIEEVTAFIGNGVRVLIKRSVQEDTSEELYEKVFSDYQAFYRVHYMDKTVPYEGMKDILLKLKERGLKLAVISNKNDTETKLLMEHFFPGIFDIVYGSMDGIPRKPAPDMVFKTVDELGLSVKDCLYIGDSEVDIATAHNADMDVLSVAWGSRTPEFLKECGATMIISKPSELLKQ